MARFNVFQTAIHGFLSIDYNSIIIIIIIIIDVK